MIKLDRVITGDLPTYMRRQRPQIFLDVPARFRPNAVGVLRVLFYWTVEKLGSRPLSSLVLFVIFLPKMIKMLFESDRLTGINWACVLLIHLSYSCRK